MLTSKTLKAFQQIGIGRRTYVDCRPRILRATDADLSLFAALLADVQDPISAD